MDNRTPSPAEDGWVTQFEKHLDVELTALIGESNALKIWRDRELESGQVFDKTIRETINDSAVFLALTSPGYLSSDYCHKELSWFTEEPDGAPRDLLVGDRMRVFNLLLRNIPHSKWPKQYGGTSGAPFHDAERAEDPGFPSLPGQPLFRGQLRKLIVDLFNTLDAIRQRHGPQAADAAAAPETVTLPPAPPVKAQVFLASTSDALGGLRSRVEKELKEEGVSVAAEMPPPHAAAQHAKEVADVIGATTLSVHLLNEFAGPKIFDAEGEFYPQKQAELGLAHARSQLIWVPQNLDIQTVEVETYRAFLDRVENGAREKEKYRFLREPPSVITRQILEQLKQQSAPVPSGVHSAVLLNTHFKDQPYTYDLTRYFHERNIKYMICPELDDPTSSVKVFVEMLKQAGTLIIIFGEVAEDWVRERLSSALQIAIAERCPLKSCGIYLAPPKKKDAGLQFNQGFYRVHLMDNSETFDPQTLAPLLG